MPSEHPMEEPRKPIANCYWVVPGKLLAGEYPGDKDEPSARAKLDKFKEANITAFVDLTEPGEPATFGDPMRPYYQWADWASHHRLAIRDQSVPKSKEWTRRILDVIDALIQSEGVVYVHCWGGIGRTGTVIGCWLARHYEPGEAALTRLQHLWQENPKSSWTKSPQNSDQFRYVRDWVE